MSILVLTSDTLIGTPATGNLEYNGQFFGTDSNASRAQMQRITQGTAVASTSGTSIDFTGLPAWIKRVTVMFNGVSTNGTSIVQIQLGSGSVTTTGYDCRVFNWTGGTAGASASSGFVLETTTSATAASVRVGLITICLLTGNTWVAGGTVSSVSSNGNSNVIQGSIALSGALDRVRITTVNGTDTFDAGSVNIMYEG